MTVLDPLARLDFANYGIGEIKSCEIPAFTDSNLNERVAALLHVSRTLSHEQRRRLIIDLGRCLDGTLVATA